MAALISRAAKHIHWEIPWVLKLNIKIESSFYQYVPHKAVAGVSKIGNLEERFVVVCHGWQSKSTDGSKSGWKQSSVVVAVVIVFIAVAM